MNNIAVNLKLVFDGLGCKNVSFNFPCADIGAGAGAVKTLMQTIVANGDIYAEPPQALSKAEFVVNSVTPVDLS